MHRAGVLERIPVDSSAPQAVMALDVGAVRIGVATARLDVRMPHPLTTLENTPQVYEAIVRLAQDAQVHDIVVGWPRGMQGQQTQQTRDVEQFVETLRATAQQKFAIHLQDEALTSQKAEAELQSRGKPYRKRDVDALAATYILEDYLHV